MKEKTLFVIAKMLYFTYIKYVDIKYTILDLYKKSLKWAFITINKNKYKNKADKIYGLYYRSDIIEEFKKHYPDFDYGFDLNNSYIELYDALKEDANLYKEFKKHAHSVIKKLKLK